MIRKIALALTALVLGVATIATPAPAMASDGPSQHSQTTHNISSTAKTARVTSLFDWRIPFAAIEAVASPPADKT